MESAQIRRYRVHEVLGSGGFGTVYRAEMITESGLRREVALKVLNEQTASNPEAARRLRDEARILSNLNHYGIVRVDDLLELEGRWTMVMELVNGIDTERLLERFGPMPLSVSLEIVGEIAQTLNAAYRSLGPDNQRLGLIHRDIKPANILVTATGGVKLLDFGVARAEIEEREAKTQQAFVMGSLPYLAPERYAFEDLHVGDVYSLGCVLYELLTTERFGRTRPSEVRHTNKVRQALHNLWQLLPDERREEVLQILSDCLTFDPDHRPSARRLAGRAQELRRRVSGPGLVEWAEKRVVPVLAEGGNGEPDDLCGRVLTHNLSGESIGRALPSEEIAPPEEEPTTPPSLQGAEPPPAPLPPPPLQPLPPKPAISQEALPPEAPPSEVPPPQAPTAGPPESGAHPVLTEEESPSQLPAIVLSLVALAFSVAFIALVMQSAELAPSEPSPASAPPPAPEVGPSLEEVLNDLGNELPETEPGDEDGVELEPEPPQLIERPPSLEGTKPQVEDDEASEPPASVNSTPIIATTPETTGRIILEGDADFLQLRGPAGTAEPGEVPVGTWTLFPSFPGGYTVRGPTITLEPGQTLRIRCVSADRTCRVL